MLRFIDRSMDRFVGAAAAGSENRTNAKTASNTQAQDRVNFGMAVPL